jgi:hypothetical protein
MARITDVSTKFSLSNPDSLCCCDTFCVINNRSCKGEIKTGTRFAAICRSTTLNTAHLPAQCDLLFVSDSSVLLFVFLMQTQCVFVKWKMTPQILIRSQENEMRRTGSTYGGEERCIESFGV